MKAVLWDLDGTLLEPNGSIRRALEEAVRHGGFPGFRDDEVLIGMPLRDILLTRTDDAAAIESMVQRFREVSFDTAWRMVRWHAGFPGVLERLQGRGVRQAIVTTKGEEEATVLLEKLDATPWFDAIVGDDDERPLKPDPAPVLEALRRLGVAPNDAVMVGDTRYDVEAGRAAGCHTIGVAWGHGSGSHGVAGADRVVDSPDALITDLDASLGLHNP